MAEKKIKTRIQQKHDVEANWITAGENNFVPMIGEVIVYDKDDTYSVPRLKIGTGSKNVNDLNFMSEGMVDKNSLVVNSDSGTISLKPEYIDYLDAQLYQAPTIKTFDIVSGDREVGTKLSISSFTHAETNVGNITGNLTLKRGTTTLLSNVSPKENITTVNVTDQITPTSAQTVTYTLSGTNTRGEAFSKNDSIKFYFPSFVGSAATSEVDASTILGSTFTKVNSGSLAGTRTIEANIQYVYFITTTAIKSIKGTNGFEVSYLQLNNVNLTINNVTKAYYVYRTNNLLTEALECVIA